MYSAVFRLFTVDQSGDWVALHSKGQGSQVDTITYGTLFDIRRARPHPRVVLTMKKSNTSQPQPVSMAPASILGSWISYYQTISGKQVDDLCKSFYCSHLSPPSKDGTVVGGPDRPIVVRAAPKKAEEGTPAEGTATNLAASVAQTQSSLYNRLTAAMNERG